MNYRTSCIALLLSSIAFTALLGQEKLRIEPLLERNLQLDIQTAYPGPLGSTFQYCDDTDEIAYFNRITTTLKFYNYQTGKPTREIPMEMEGPNSVEPDPFYCYYHNRDSIFVLSSGNNFKLILLDGFGNKINTFPYGEPANYELPLPAPARVFGVMALNEDMIYLAVNIPWRKLSNDVAPVIAIDLKHKKSWFLKEPVPYNSIDLNKIVAPNQYRTEFYSTRIAYNHKKDDLVINYALDENLYRLHEGKVNKAEAKSELLGEFQFLKNGRDSYQKNSKQLLEPIYSGAWYYGILYDRFRDCYYRIGKMGVERSKARQRINGEKVKIPYEYVVMTLDDDLKVIDEIKFSTKEAIVHRGIFVGPDGLHVAQLNTKGEDIMGFSTFTLSRVEKD